MGVFRRQNNGKRSKVWWIGYQGPRGQIRESSGSTNKRVAEKFLALRKGQAVEERLGLPRTQSPRLGQWPEDFLKSIGHGKTRSRYQSSVNNILRHFGPQVRLADINPEWVFRFQQKRLEEGAGKATANRDVGTLSSLFSHAKKLRLASQNPCRDIGKLNERRERRQARPLSYDNESRIKQFAPQWLSVLITLLADTGLRVMKEALPLRWSDVQLSSSETACICIRDSKTVAGIRTVWLTDHCRDVLLAWQKTLGPTFSPFVFPSPRDPKSHIADYKKAWRDAANKAGFADKFFRIYDLRATFASRANMAHASSMTLAHLLGHSSITILPVYAKPIDENTKMVIEKLDEARRQICNLKPVVQ
jgi:site-specific recombinase XerD